MPKNIPVSVTYNQQGRGILSVSWDTSGVCNYRCSYCDSEYHDGRAKFPPLENIVNFLEDLSQKRNQKLYLEIKGGEPSYWKHISEFLEVCGKNRWGTCLVTNGSRKLDWWEKNLIHIADVNLSLHPEFFNLQEMIEKIDFIHRRRMTLVKYMMHIDLFEKCVQDIDEIRTKLPTANVRAFFLAQPGTGNRLYPYSDTQIKKVKEINRHEKQSLKRLWPAFEFEDRYSADINFSDGQSTELEAQHVKIERLNQFSGWKCNAGLDRIQIDIYGNIYRGQCKQGDQLGNIHTGEWTLPDQPVVCEKELCFCGSELLLKKWNPELICLSSD